MRGKIRKPDFQIKEFLKDDLEFQLDELPDNYRTVSRGN